MARAPHIPVLLRETIEALDPRPGQTIVDCTLGLGGHSSAILDRIKPGGTLVALDLDPANLELARERLGKTHGPSGRHVTYHLVHANFAALPAVLAKLDIPRVHAVLADIGVASTQIDDPQRGFSYRRPGPLDMRMDTTRGEPASALLARMPEADLAEALLALGDEENAPKIAKLIVQRRAQTPIATTEQLAAIVCQARDFTLERAANAKLHPAARTFQALRILVNRELGNLDRLLTVLPDVLLPGGVAAVITFHSGEDRRVKSAFKDCLRAGIYSDIAHEPITADASELHRNQRAKPAKLRWARLAAQAPATPG